jgi:hypothetical protein
MIATMMGPFQRLQEANNRSSSHQDQQHHNQYQEEEEQYPQDMNSIETPHEHDVLSGRGNFVNYHAGNEYFRELVRKHKVAYVACPKAQKGKFSLLIYDEIKARNPPGRYLKQDPKTKLWYDIGEKKALDKTRQALREGAPDIQKELTGDSGEDCGDNSSGGRRRSSASQQMQAQVSACFCMSAYLN